MLMTRALSCSNLRVVTEVARSLEFSPFMHSLADRIITAIAARSPDYNAVHLRIEKDARDWSQIMGGPEVGRMHCPATDGPALPEDPALLHSRLCSESTHVHRELMSAYDVANLQLSAWGSLQRASGGPYPPSITLVYIDSHVTFRPAF